MKSTHENTDDQLCLSGLGYFCAQNGCKEEVDYYAMEMDGVMLCNLHWIDWSKSLGGTDNENVEVQFQGLR